MFASSSHSFGLLRQVGVFVNGLVVLHHVHGDAFHSTAGLRVALAIETKDPLRLTHFAMSLDDFHRRHAGSGSQFLECRQ
jgi:hypothetical protein